MSPWERQCRPTRTGTREKKVALVILSNICGLMSRVSSRTGEKPERCSVICNCRAMRIP